MSKISVIVPVYNVEKYLSRCVESILAQTFRDIEIILVNDGSSDNGGAICDEYALRDPRVRVLHKENGGLSDARNAGLDIAQGAYITFIDSDDYIHPRMIEVLYQALIEHGTAVSLCKFMKTYGEPLDETASVPKAECWKTEAFYLHDSMTATIACAKLYKAECFASLRYPVGKVHEDEFLTYKILFQFEQISVVDAPLYGYFRNADGITRSRWNPKRMMVFDAFEEQLDYFRSLEKTEIIKDRYGNYLWTIGNQIKLMEQNGERTHLSQCRSRLRKVIRRYRKEFRVPFEKCVSYYEKAYPRLVKPIHLWARFAGKIRGK